MKIEFGMKMCEHFYYELIICLRYISVTAQPICLPEPWSVTSNNGLLVGWGKTAGQLGENIIQDQLRNFLIVLNHDKIFFSFYRSVLVPVS